jgi:chorismate mutase / prephenate dehydratase
MTGGAPTGGPGCWRCASRSTRRPRVAGAAEPPRRAGAGGGRIKKREGSVVFRPEREAQVIDGLKSANPGPAAPPTAWRRSGARSCRPAGAGNAARAWPTSARPAPSAKRRRWATSARAAPVPCANFDEVFHATAAGAAEFRRGAGGELHRRRGGALARPVPALAAVHHRRDQPVRAPQPAAPQRTRWTASRPCWPTRRRWRSARTGCPITCRNAERRAGGQQRRRRPPGRQDPTLAGHRQRTRAASEFGLHVVAPAIQDEAYNRTRFAVVTLPHAAMPQARATTAPAWWCRCPTAPAPCTTCWCR